MTKTEKQIEDEAFLQQIKDAVRDLAFKALNSDPNDPEAEKALMADSDAIVQRVAIRAGFKTPS